MLTPEEILDRVQNVMDGIESDSTVHRKATQIVLGTPVEVETLLDNPEELQSMINSEYERVVTSLNTHYEPGWEFIDWQDQIDSDGNPRYVLHEASGVICYLKLDIAGGLHRLLIAWKVLAVRTPQ